MRKIKLLKQKNRFDLWIVVLSMVLSFFGLLMVYEASNVTAFSTFGDKYYFVREQAFGLIVGGAVFVFTSFFSYKKYYNLAIFILLFTVFILLLVFIPGIGVQALGARRWVNLPFVNFQPSEIAKLAVVIYLSSWLSSKEKGRFFAYLLLFFMIIGLVLLQPDMGTAVILSIIFLTVYFFSGAPFVHFILLIPLFLVGAGFLAISEPYRMARVMSFFDINHDPLGASYHIRQIIISLGSGGLFGLGMGASRGKFQYLPEATTDSIFAIIGEEFGFFGSTIFILVYIILLTRIFLTAKNAKDKLGKLMAGGIFVYFASQIILNLAAMVAILPLTGVPLIFISYGGSSLVVALAAAGIVVNISKNTVSDK